MLFLSLWLICSLIFYLFILICSHLHQFMETLRKECHWLRSMSWQVSILCTICLEERISNDEPCMRHNKEKACLHHDCAEYIPLETFGWCARAGRHIPRDKLQPWIEVNLDVRYKYVLPFLSLMDPGLRFHHFSALFVVFDWIHWFLSGSFSFF